MNIQLDNYDHAAFQRLNEFVTSKQLLAEHEHEIESLGDVIRQFHFEHMLGVCLLHKHFEIEADELLVESIDSEAATIRPDSIAIRNHTIPYMWHLTGLEDGDLRWLPLEFVRKDCIEESHITFIDQLAGQTDFFAAFADRLLSLGVANLFGLALHHRDRIKFDRTNMKLLETDSPSDRLLSIRPVPRQSSSPSDWTQTLWRFPKRGGVVSESDCNGHGCAGHCGEHGGSHVGDR